MFGVTVKSVESAYFFHTRTLRDVQCAQFVCLGDDVDVSVAITFAGHLHAFSSTCGAVLTVITFWVRKTFFRHRIARATENH